MIFINSINLIPTNCCIYIYYTAIFALFQDNSVLKAAQSGTHANGVAGSFICTICETNFVDRSALILHASAHATAGIL